MRFTVLTEAETPPGMTGYQRYKEAMKNVQVAEEVGFTHGVRPNSTSRVWWHVFQHQKF